MAEPTEPSGSPEDSGFLDDLDDLDAYDAQHEQPSFQQRLADASMAVIVGGVALIALVSAVIGFGIGTQVGGDPAKAPTPPGGGRGGGAAVKPVPARVLGPVTKTNGRLVTVADVGGSNTIVGIGPKASVFVSTASSPSAVRVGSRVMNVSTRPLQATQVVVAPAGAKVGAVVRAVKPGSLTLVGLGGKPLVVSTVGARFLVARPASFTAVTVGKRIVAYGLRGKSGVAAQSVVILP